MAALPLSFIATADNKTTDAITESRLETQIWTTYALSPYLRSLDLSVAVNDGKATLTGHADEEVKKELAQQIAMGVDASRYASLQRKHFGTSHFNHFRDADGFVNRRYAITNL